MPRRRAIIPEIALSADDAAQAGTIVTFSPHEFEEIDIVPIGSGLTEREKEERLANFLKTPQYSQHLLVLQQRREEQIAEAVASASHDLEFMPPVDENKFRLSQVDKESRLAEFVLSSAYHSQVKKLEIDIVEQKFRADMTKLDARHDEDFKRMQATQALEEAQLMHKIYRQDIEVLNLKNLGKITERDKEEIEILKVLHLKSLEKIIAQDQSSAQQNRVIPMFHSTLSSDKAMSCPFFSARTPFGTGSSELPLTLKETIKLHAAREDPDDEFKRLREFVLSKGMSAHLENAKKFSESNTECNEEQIAEFIPENSERIHKLARDFKDSAINISNDAEVDLEEIEILKAMKEWDTVSKQKSEERKATEIKEEDEVLVYLQSLIDKAE